MTPTHELLMAANRDLSDMRRKHADQRHTLEREQEHEARPLVERVAELKAQYEREISEAATHPDEGRRVFRDESIYQSKWSYRPIGTKRITGVVEIWRVGASAQRGFTPDVGTPVVRLVKADGTPGVKCEYFQSFYGSKWTFEDGQPSRVPQNKETK